MFGFIFQILTFFKLFLTFSIFSFIYKYLYTSCSEKKVIKSKDERPKKVIKTRIGLSFVYLALLTTLYFSLTWYVLFTLVLMISTLIILLTHKFDSSTLDIFKKYDSYPIVKKFWYFYSFIVNIIFKLMGPIHTFLENIINKNKQLIYDIFFDRLAKKDFNPLDSFFNTGIMENLFLSNNTNDTNEINLTKNITDNFERMTDSFKKSVKNDKLNDNMTISNSTKKIIEDNDKIVNKLDKFEITDNIQDFLTNIEQKMKIVTNTPNNTVNDGEDLSAFIKKTDIFSSITTNQTSDEEMFDSSSN